MFFTVEDAKKQTLFPSVEASSIMALAFFLKDLEQEQGLKVDRSQHTAPEVEAAAKAWKGGIGNFGGLTVRLIPHS